MASVLTVFIVSILMCCGIAYILGLFWFSDKRNRRMRSFFLLGIGIFIWTLLNAITMIVNIDYFFYIYTLRMVLVCIIPFSVSWFILDFTSSPLHKKIWVRNIFIALPVADIVLMVTNPLHHLYFIDYSYPMPGRGMIFWGHTGMDLVVIVIAFIILIRFIVKGARKNPLLILTGIGMLIPYALNMLYSFGLMPFPHDLTPIGFFFTFFLFVFVAYRSQLFKAKTALFSSTMDTIEDLIVICNEKDIIIDVNEKAASVFHDFSITTGRTKSDGFFEYLNSIVDDADPEDLISSLKSGVDVDGECTLRLPSGNKRTYTIMWRAVYEGKTKSGYILVMTDVSNYREVIREINKQKDELLELKIKAESANRAKSDFLANMSHELRTPINAITGMTAIAKSTSDTDRIEYALDKIEKASVHLLGVISDILDMSKIEADKLELSLVPFDFEVMLQRVVSITNFKALEKNQDFSLEIDESIPRYLVGDDLRLSQVITNLLSNAVKFTPEEGSIKLKAFLKTDADESVGLQFDIVDSGIGISEEQQARLFKSFGQAESGTMRKYGGTGLGLAISKRFVEMMGGEIWFTSEPGKGSVFSFTIKADKTDENSVESFAGGGDTGGREPEEKIDSFEGRRVLLAEDVDINREIVLTLLEPTQIKIDCAQNGLEAVRMYRDDPDGYDMILMDVQMPEMDGYEATRLIRAMDLQKAKEIPIIAITANVFREDIEKCMEAGMNEHIGKPLDFDDVIKTLRKYLTAE